MFYKGLIAFGLAMMISFSAHAECNAICKRKCEENPGAQSVANCIKLWSCINANYGGAAGKFQYAQPPAKCKHLFKPKA